MNWLMFNNCILVAQGIHLLLLTNCYLELLYTSKFLQNYNLEINLCCTDKWLMCFVCKTRGKDKVVLFGNIHEDRGQCFAKD